MLHLLLQVSLSLQPNTIWGPVLTTAHLRFRSISCWPILCVLTANCPFPLHNWGYAMTANLLYQYTTFHIPKPLTIFYIFLSSRTDALTAPLETADHPLGMTTTFDSRSPYSFLSMPMCPFPYARLTASSLYTLSYLSIQHTTSLNPLSLIISAC